MLSLAFQIGRLTKESWVKELCANITKDTRLYKLLRRWAENRKQTKELAIWERDGKPSPPPHIIKQRALKHYAKTYKTRILVETGTYLGDMVAAMQPNFDYIYSIELSEELYNNARERFKNEPNIELIHGDSGSALGEIVRKINQPALFWLDGHYSEGITAKGDKDTPVYEELEHILNTRDDRHIIIIDDARCFGADPSYPTIGELESYVLGKRPDIDFEIKNDSIRITPKH